MKIGSQEKTPCRFEIPGAEQKADLTGHRLDVIGRRPNSNRQFKDTPTLGTGNPLPLLAPFTKKAGYRFNALVMLIQLIPSFKRSSWSQATIAGEALVTFGGVEVFVEFSRFHGGRRKGLLSFLPQCLFGSGSARRS